LYESHHRGRFPKKLDCPKEIETFWQRLLNPGFLHHDLSKSQAQMATYACYVIGMTYVVTVEHTAPHVDTNDASHSIDERCSAAVTRWGSALAIAENESLFSPFDYYRLQGSGS
jgi:hypothetical protein